MPVRKIGTLSLCGLMIGAVLGSGVIILPPLAIGLAGDWALPSWVLTAVFGVAFAYVFAHVGTLFPGDGGASSAVARAFGPGAKRLSAYALTGAALFGPAAVMLTIVDYLPSALLPETAFGRGLASILVLLTCVGLQLSGLRNTSRITLVLSVLATGLLLVGSILVLTSQTVAPQPLPPIAPGQIGHTLLLLFWAVVGWEVAGNYGAEVENPRRTVPRAAIIAAVIVGLVDVAVGAGMQYGIFPPQAGHGVAGLLHPMFGSFSPWIMGGLTAALCATTYLMFVGAVSRLAAHMAEDDGLPRILAGRNRFGAPHAVLLAYTLAHTAQIVLAGLGVLDVAGIVAIANGFFLVNALLGTLAATKLLPGTAARTTAGLLSLGVALVLLQSSWPILAVSAALAVWLLRPTFLFPRRKTARPEPQP